MIFKVDGVSAPATAVRRVALDPSPGRDSPRADDLRADALACVEFWARDDLAMPAAPGSAILETISAASRESPALIIVVSDGMANSGAMDLNTLGFDVAPGALAASLQDSRSLEPRLEGVTIVWTDLANSQSNPPQQQIRAALESIWRQVLEAAGAKVEFATETAVAGGTARPDLPEDHVDVPAVTVAPIPCGDEHVVPSALLFAPDSPVLLAGADDILADVAAALTQRDGSRAIVSGHTAHHGTAAGRQQLSEERAEVVKRALVRLGATAAQIDTQGFGSNRPVPGTAAEDGANRRVVIEIIHPGCQR